MINDDEDGIDIDVVVNFNPSANIVGATNTLKGGDVNSESSAKNESEVEVEQEADIEVKSKSKSKSKSTSEGGGGFVPPGQQDDPPGGGSQKAPKASKSFIAKLLPGKKKDVDET